MQTVSTQQLEAPAATIAQGDVEPRAGVETETAFGVAELVNSLRSAQAARSYPSLDHETRAGVETDCAAFHLNREPQTLRVWACKENGPLRPLRINGRLMWPTQKLRELCGVT